MVMIDLIKYKDTVKTRQKQDIATFFCVMKQIRMYL